MVIISSYAGFQCIGNDDLVQGVREGLEEEGFTIERMERDEKEFRIIAQGAEGIRYYARHLFADGERWRIGLFQPRIILLPNLYDDIKYCYTK